MTITTILILIALIGGLSMVKIEDKKENNTPRRPNGQYKRKVAVRELGKVTSYIYL